MKTSFSNRFLSGLALVIAPIVLMFWVFSFVVHQDEFVESSMLLTEANAVGKEFIKIENNRRFWAEKLRDFFIQAKSRKEFLNKLFEIRAETKHNFDYLIWDDNNQVASSSFVVLPAQKKVWQKAAEDFQAFLIASPSADMKMNELRLRKTFGPQLLASSLKKCLYPNNPELLKFSTATNQPLSWVAFKKEFAAIVFFPPSVNKKNTWLNYLTLSSRQRYPGLNIEFFPEIPIQDRESIENVMENERFYYVCKRIDANGYLKFSRRKSLLQKFAKVSGKFTLLFALFLGGLWVKNDFLANFRRIRIKTAMVALLLLTNILPAVGLWVLNDSYLKKKEVSFLESKKLQADQFLAQLEASYLNKMDAGLKEAFATVDWLEKNLLKRSFDGDLAKELRKKTTSTDFKIDLVASQGLPIFSNSYFNNGRERLMWETEESFGKDENLIEFKKKVSQVFLGMWNRRPYSEKIATELEIIAEMAFQKPLWHICHQFIQMLDNLNEFNFGTSASKAAIKVFSIHSKDIIDYIAFIQPDSKKLSSNFFRENHTVRLGNPEGFKVSFCSENRADYQIVLFKDSDVFFRIINNLLNFPGPELQTVVIDGQSWGYTGKISRIIDDYRLLALFPTDAISRDIRRQKREFFLLILFCLLILVCQGMIFSHLITHPLDYLYKGNAAIQTQKFSYRLPSLGKNELGLMAETLNGTLQDLEELNAAKIVQQKLFPVGALKDNGVSIFGKTICLNELGGDYLDYFQVKPQKFAFLLGDVAGHGVGAALIMAAAKAAIISIPELLEEPYTVLEKLHSMVYSLKNKKQKKVMTLQYGFLDLEKKVLKIANAGGCSPFVMRFKKSEAEILSFNSAVLGAFKKSKIEEKVVEFEPGDALVFYSDGLAETTDSHGKMIGFDGIQKALPGLFDPDPEIFFAKIYNWHLQWLGTEKPQDDFSVLIVSFVQNSGEKAKALESSED